MAIIKIEDNHAFADCRGQSSDSDLSTASTSLARFAEGEAMARILWDALQRDDATFESVVEATGGANFSLEAVLALLRIGQIHVSASVEADFGRIAERARAAAIDRAKHAANAKHETGREKKKDLLDVWGSGKYKTKQACAESEASRLFISVETARKWLREKKSA